MDTGEAKTRKKLWLSSLVIFVLLVLGFSLFIYLGGFGNDQSDTSAATPAPAESTAAQENISKYSESQESDCAKPTEEVAVDLLVGEKVEILEVSPCQFERVIVDSEGNIWPLSDPVGSCNPPVSEPYIADLGEGESVLQVELIPCEFSVIVSGPKGDRLARGSSEAEEAWQAIVSPNSDSPAGQPTQGSGLARTGGSPERSNTVPDNPPWPFEPEIPNAGGAPYEEPDTPMMCPTSRQENPDIFDACREGFAPPTQLVFTGISRCVKTYEPDPPSNWPGVEPRPPGNYPVYTITYGYEIVGGNFKDVSWSGVSSFSGRKATLSSKIRGLQETPFSSYPIPIDASSYRVSFESMDSRYLGFIDSMELSTAPFGTEPVAPTVSADFSACN